MRLHILGGGHLITVFEGAVERAQAFKAYAQGNIQHGHIAFQQQLRRLAAANRRQIIDHGAAQIIMKQPGKPAFAIAELARQAFHPQGLLIIILQKKSILTLYKNSLHFRYDIH